MNESVPSVMQYCVTDRLNYMIGDDKLKKWSCRFCMPCYSIVGVLESSCIEESSFKLLIHSSIIMAESLHDYAVPACIYNPMPD